MRVLVAAAAVLVVAALSNCSPSGGGAAAQQAPPQAGVYQLDQRHASIYVRVNHMGFSRTVVRFNTISAELALNTEAPEQSRVEATIDAASIDSGLASFDGFLRGARFLNAAQNPQIRYESRTIQRTGETTARVTGDLTMNGQTHPLTLDVTFNGAGRNPFEAGSIAGFSATGTLSRAQWGLDAFAQLVADEVEFFVEAEFVTGR